MLPADKIAALWRKGRGWSVRKDFVLSGFLDDQQGKLGIFICTPRRGTIWGVHIAYCGALQVFDVYSI